MKNYLRYHRNNMCIENNITITVYRNNRRMHSGTYKET